MKLNHDTRTITGLRLGGGADWPIKTRPVSEFAKDWHRRRARERDPLADFGAVPNRWVLLGEDEVGVECQPRESTDAATVGDVSLSPTVADYYQAAGRASRLTASDYKTAPAGNALWRGEGIEGIAR